MSVLRQGKKEKQKCSKYVTKYIQKMFVNSENKNVNRNVKH